MLSKTRTAVAQSLEDAGVREKLKQMLSDPSLNTSTSYSANAALYPDHEMPFVDKHIAYLIDHPNVSHEHYIANLRLMLKVRQ